MYKNKKETEDKKGEIYDNVFLNTPPERKATEEKMGVWPPDCLLLAIISDSMPIIIY